MTATARGAAEPPGAIILNIEDLNGLTVHDEDGPAFVIYDETGQPIVEIRAAMFRPDRSAIIQGAFRFTAQWSRHLTHLTAAPPTRKRNTMRNTGKFPPPNSGEPPNGAAAWTKSSASGPYNDACVEVCRDGDTVQVRDSKDRTGPVLSFTGAEWDAFITGAKAGEFDRR